MRAIARAVGLTPPALADKRELMSAVLERVCADLGRAMADADDRRPDDPNRRLLQPR